MWATSRNEELKANFLYASVRLSHQTGVCVGSMNWSSCLVQGALKQTGSQVKGFRKWQRRERTYASKGFKVIIALFALHKALRNLQVAYLNELHINTPASNNSILCILRLQLAVKDKTNFLDVHQNASSYSICNSSHCWAFYADLANACHQVQVVLFEPLCAFFRCLHVQLVTLTFSTKKTILGDAKPWTLVRPARQSRRQSLLIYTSA